MIKKRIFGIFLIFSLVFPFTGTWFWLNYQKKLVKREIRKQLNAGAEREKLVLLKFTKEEEENNLNWEHSREFEYNGRMYDVMKKEVIGKMRYYYCWADKEETELKNRIRKLVAYKLGNDPQKKKRDSRLADFYNSLFSSEIFHWQALMFPRNPDTYFGMAFKCIIRYISTPAPPP